MPFTTWEDFATWLLGTPLRIVVIVIGAFLLRWLLHRAICGVEERAIQRGEQNRPSRVGRVLGDVTLAADERRRQRALTMGSLLRSIATFAIATVAILTVMAEVGLPLGPLLASAGVGGVALGFGAQSLVKDFLSGIFMILEDQYGVGDVIDTGEAVGTVEEVTLRVTRLRDASGVVWFIRNGEIVRIGNHSQGWAMATIDIPVSYEEEPTRVIPILLRVVEELHVEAEWADKLLEVPRVAGVESVSGGVMTMRIFAKCRPGDQWSVMREIRERAKVALDAEGIRGPQITSFGGQPPA